MANQEERIFKKTYTDFDKRLDQELDEEKEERRRQLLLQAPDFKLLNQMVENEEYSQELAVKLKDGGLYYLRSGEDDTAEKFMGIFRRTLQSHPSVREDLFKQAGFLGCMAFKTKNFTDPFRVLKGFSEAKKILKKIKPDIVFSKGGFVSVPVVRAAGALKIPYIVHESDMTPGLANKLSMAGANKICCNFPETMTHLPAEKAVLTGTPIREELGMGDAAEGKKKESYDQPR